MNAPVSLEALIAGWRSRADAIDSEMPPVTTWSNHNYALAGSADVLHSCADELSACMAMQQGAGVTRALVPRRIASDYVDGTYGPDDLAAIWNACCEAHKSAPAAPQPQDERPASMYGIVNAAPPAHGEGELCNYCGFRPVDTTELQAAFSTLADFNPGADEFNAALEVLRNGIAAEPRDAKAARAEFERWVAKRWGCSLERWADSGEYHSHHTRYWWQCWQAALTTAPKCWRGCER